MYVVSTFPRAIPDSAFVGRSRELLDSYGFARDNCLPMIGTCRDELAFALTAPIQAAWGPAFSMSGLAGMLVLGRTGVAAARTHAPLLGGRRRFVLFGLTHIGVDCEGEIGRCERPGLERTTGACGALLALEHELGGQQGHPVGPLDPEDPEQSLLRQRLLSRVEPGVAPDLVYLTRIALSVIVEDLRRAAGMLRRTDPADVAVFTGIQIHAPGGREYVEPGPCFLQLAGDELEIPLALDGLSSVDPVRR